MINRTKLNEIRKGKGEIANNNEKLFNSNQVLATVVSEISFSHFLELNRQPMG